MGTPGFAATILRGMLDIGYHVVAVYTKPEKPSGRGKNIVPSPVKMLAEERRIPVEQPVRFDEATLGKLREYEPDLILVAAYGKILPKAVLEMPGFGCVNVHASLLPKYRGASPIQNALLQGEKETGITLMRMDEGLDTGDIISQTTREITPDDTQETLLSKLADDGVSLTREVLPLFIEERLTPKPQDDSRATLCQLIEREDGRIFWNESAETIWNRYRGLDPLPGIFTFWEEREGVFLRLKLTKISIQRTDPATRHALGEVFEIGEHIAIQTGKGLILLEEVQPEGKKPMPIRDFLNGRPALVGDTLR